MSTDRIEKQILLHVPISRVWQAISDSTEFGSWFGVKFDGPFVENSPLQGMIVPTSVDLEVARAQEPFAGVRFEIDVVQVEHERFLSFRWHPLDCENDPATLVEFALRNSPEGTHLTISESGFDQLPEDKRGKALSMNEQGWSGQLMLIEKYLRQRP